MRIGVMCSGNGTNFENIVILIQKISLMLLTLRHKLLKVRSIMMSKGGKLPHP